MSGFWVSLLGGLSGAFLAVVGAEFARFFFEKGKRLERTRDVILFDMLAQLKSLESVAVQYWRGDYAAGSKDISVAEHDIKVGLHSLIQDSNDLFGSNSTLKTESEGAIRKLRSIATGGDFGDGQVIIDLNTALEIQTQMSDLKRTFRNGRDKLKQKLL
jgi:hypothetical protein